MFAKVQIYCSGKEVCFDDIKNSALPTVIINTNHIVSISKRTTWGFCRGHENFPYRVMKMINGEVYYCVLESIDELMDSIILKGE